MHGELTLRSVLKQSAEKYATRPALAHVDGHALTYADLAMKAGGLSRVLHDRGVVAGDRVALLSENQPHWGVAYFAITAMGAVVVPILPDFHATEIRHIIRHAACKAIFVSRRLAPVLEGEEFKNLRTVIELEDFSLVSRGKAKGNLTKLLEQGSQEFSKLKQAALRLAGRIPSTVQPDDIAAIVYTSGTTGHSKGVMLTHRNIVSDAASAIAIVDVTHEDRMLSVLPLSHTYECTLGMVAPIMTGASIYYLDKPPSAGVLLPALGKVKPTIMLTVPLIIEKIFKARVLPELTRHFLVRNIYRIPFFRKRLHRIAGKKLLATFGGSLRVFCVGGASLAADVELFLREAGFPYAIGYGLTETAPLIVGTNPARTRFRSTGVPLQGTQIRIQNPDPQSGEGEILVKGPTVMKGYYRDPVRTAESFTADGWFRTGDLGLIDQRGYLFIKGRLKNVIIGSSGKNIYPEEIESIINEFEIVSESLVCEQNGQLVARVYLNYEELDREFAAQNVPDSEIRKHIADRLRRLREQINERVAGFSRISRIIEQTEPFEKTPTQKIKRHLYV